VSRRKILIVAGVVVALAGITVVNLRYGRSAAVEVTTEEIRTRDLEAVVSASGKVQAKRFVNISADTMGRIVNLAVNEGDRVAKGQFLLQIDPRNLKTAVDRGEAGLAAARSQLQQTMAALGSAEVQLELATETLGRQEDLWRRGLTTKETYDRAVADKRVAEATLQERQQQVATQRQRISQEVSAVESARYDLSKVRIEAPFDGIVTRRNIEEGETVVIGTMNNPGTVLLTIADMSVIEAEVEVDETDIPTLALGQPATITIDALPDREFRGRVTEIGNSPIQESDSGATRQATNFMVVVTIDQEIPEVRPGFTCTADITTATRQQAVAVPIQATTIREVRLDESGQIVRDVQQDERGNGSSVSPEELPEGQRLEEVEGVFVVRDSEAVFTPIKTGIAGDRYFEVIEGLTAGDRVITGPFSSVRELGDGVEVRIQESNGTRS
jgi:HlyD family secretion protein